VSRDVGLKKAGNRARNRADAEIGTTADANAVVTTEIVV